MRTWNTKNRRKQREFQCTYMYVIIYPRWKGARVNVNMRNILRRSCLVSSRVREESGGLIGSYHQLVPTTLQQMVRNNSNTFVCTITPTDGVLHKTARLGTIANIEQTLKA